MAFPNQLSVTETPGDGIGSGTYDIDLSATNDGDLLVIVGYCRTGSGAGTVTQHADWEEIYNDPLSIYGTNAYVAFSSYLLCDGTEGPTVTFTSNQSIARWKAFCYRFEAGTFEDPVIQPPESVIIEVGSGTSIFNPPSLDPAGGTKDFHWLAIAHIVGYAYSVSTFPTGYGDTDWGPGGYSGGQPSVGIASRALAGDSEDPDNFVLSSSGIGGHVATIAIHPASGGGGTTYLDISGSATVEAQSEAELSEILSVLAQVKANATTQGALSSLSGITGLASAGCRLSGDLASVLGLGGDAIAQGELDGSTSLTLGISSALRVRASTTASASMVKGVSGGLVVDSKSSGSLALIKGIVGEIAVEPNVQASFSKIVSLAASLGVEAACSATVSSLSGISGTVAATAGFSGSLVDAAVLDISGSAGVIAQVAAELSKLVSVGGQASTVSTSEGAVSLALSVSGTAQVAAETTGNASLLLGISGSLEAIAEFTGNLDKYDVNSLQALTIEKVIIGPQLKGSAKLNATLSGTVGGGPQIDINKIVIH